MSLVVSAGAHRVARLLTVFVPASGEVDLDNAATLRTCLQAAVNVGATCIVVDLSALTCFDSSGLAALLHTAEQLGPGGQLTLRRPSSAVRRALEATGLDTCFEIER